MIALVSSKSFIAPLKLAVSGSTLVALALDASRGWARSKGWS